MSLKGTKTNNLKEAFAGESQANRRYLYFAQKADVEGYNDVAAVFRSTAEGETGHCPWPSRIPRGSRRPGDGRADRQHLGEPGGRRRDARVHRHVPGMARTARDEGFDEIADWFETLAKAEKPRRRFQKALDALPE